MTAISELSKPAALTGAERLPVLQDVEAVGLPLFALGPSLPRGAVVALQLGMTADLSATTDADPGAGKVRWNHATQASATVLYVDDADTEVSPTDVAALLAALAENGFLYLHGVDKEDRGKWQKWRVDGVEDASGYSKLAVTHLASGDPFEPDDPVHLSLQQPNPAAGVDRNVLTTVSAVSGTLTLDASLGDYFKTTLTANISTLAVENVPTCASLTLSVIQDSSPRTFAWPASFKWAGAAPAIGTGAASRNRLFITTDNGGATWDATLLKDLA